MGRGHIAIAIWGILECLFLAGVLFGWGSLVFVFKEEGIYYDLCVSNYVYEPSAQHHNNQSLLEVVSSTGAFNPGTEPKSDTVIIQSCPEQEEKFALAFMISSVVYNFFVAFIGFIALRFGLRIARTIVLCVYVTGTLCLAFVSKENPWLIFPGLICIASGGVPVYITNAEIAYMFSRGGSVVIGAMSGATDSSVLTPLLMKISHQNGIPRKYSFLFLTGLCVFLFSISTYCFLPKDHVKKKEDYRRNVEIQLENICNHEETVIEKNLTTDNETVNDNKLCNNNESVIPESICNDKENVFEDNISKNNETVSENNICSVSETVIEGNTSNGRETLNANNLRNNSETHTEGNICNDRETVIENNICNDSEVATQNNICNGGKTVIENNICNDDNEVATQNNICNDGEIVIRNNKLNDCKEVIEYNKFDEIENIKCNDSGIVIENTICNGSETVIENKKCSDRETVIENNICNGGETVIENKICSDRETVKENNICNGSETGIENKNCSDLEAVIENNICKGSETVIENNICNDSGTVIENNICNCSETFIENNICNGSETVIENNVCNDSETAIGNKQYSDRETVIENSICNDNEASGKNKMSNDSEMVIENIKCNNSETVIGNNLCNNNETVVEKYSYSPMTGHGADHTKTEALNVNENNTKEQQEQLSIPPLKKCFFNIKYVLHLCWYLILQFRYLYFMERLNKWLTDLNDAESEKVSYYLDVSFFTFMVGFVFALIANVMYDVLIQKYKDRKVELCRKLMPAILPLTLGSALCTLMSSLVLIPAIDVIYLTFIIVAAFRAVLYSIVVSYISFMFPGKYLTFLVGVCSLSSGVVNALMFAVFQWSGAYPEANMHINIVLLVLSVASFVHPFYQWLTCYRTERKESKRK